MSASGDTLFLQQDTLSYSADSTDFATQVDTVCEVNHWGLPGIPREHDNTAGLKSFLFFVLILGLLAYIVGRKQQLGDFVKSFFSQGRRSHLREPDVRIVNFRNALFFCAIMVGSLFASLFIWGGMVPQPHDNTVRSFLMSRPAVLQTVSWRCFLESALLVSGFAIAKSLLMLIWGRIHLKGAYCMTPLQSFVSTFNLIACGLFFLLLLNGIFHLGGLALGMAFAIIWLIIKLLSLPRTTSVFSAERVSGFQLFLYLCGLELLPVCILCRSIFLLG